MVHQKNRPIEKEIHLPNLDFSGSMRIFQGAYLPFQCAGCFFWGSDSHMQFHTSDATKGSTIMREMSGYLMPG